MVFFFLSFIYFFLCCRLNTNTFFRNQKDRWRYLHNLHTRFMLNSSSLSVCCCFFYVSGWRKTKTTNKRKKNISSRRRCWCLSLNASCPLKWSFFSLFLSIFFFRCFCLCSLIWSVYMPVIVSFQVITYHYLSGSDFKSGFVSHSFDSVCFWYRKIENKSIWCDSSKSYSPHDNWFIVFCVFFRS